MERVHEALVIAILLTLGLILGGCTMPSGTADIGQNEAWMEVSKAKMEAAARLAEAEALKADADRATKPQIIIDSAAELQEYAAMQRDAAMLAIVQAQAETVKALTGNRDAGPLDIPPQPKDQWAQRIESTGSAIHDATSTTTALVFGVAKVASENAGTRYEASGQGSSVTTTDVAQSSKRDMVSGTSSSTSTDVADYNQVSDGPGQQAEVLDDADTTDAYNTEAPADL